MKFRRLLIAALAVLFMFSGCAYVNIKTPYDTNVDETEFGARIGKASSYSVIWLVSWGDSSYAAAAKNGGITVMKHADQQIQQFLFGLFVKRTIIVYGD